MESSSHGPRPISAALDKYLERHKGRYSGSGLAEEIVLLGGPWNGSSRWIHEGASLDIDGAVYRRSENFDRFGRAVFIFQGE